MGFAELGDAGFDSSARRTEQFGLPLRQYHSQGESLFTCEMDTGPLERIQGNHLKALNKVRHATNILYMPGSFSLPPRQGTELIY